MDAAGNAYYMDLSYNVYPISGDDGVYNGDWAPTRGSSAVYDYYPHGVAWQRFSWDAGKTTRFRTGKQKGLEIETLELGKGPRGCGKSCRQYFGKGVYEYNGGTRRSYTWNSNLPGAYLDEQVFSDYADEEENVTVGSVAPENIVEGTEYYTWVRYRERQLSMDRVKVNAQLYDRSCDYASAFCNVFKVVTVKVVPFSCGHWTGYFWYTWRYDGIGSEGEQCYRQ